MRSLLRLVAALPIVLAAATHALAQENDESGAELAAKHCSLCHDVSPEGGEKEYPPSFAAIARFRAPEQIYARIVFPAMHSGMPEAAFYLLSRDQVTALVDYIVSLEK